MAFGNRIKEAREHLHWDQAELAKRAGVAQPTLSAIETRDSDRTSYKEQLVGALPMDKISLDYVRTGRGSLLAIREIEPEYAGPMTSMRPVVVVGTARLGDNGYYEEISSQAAAGDGTVEVFSRDPNAYALKMRGDSMWPAIRDGWYVVVEPNSAPTVGEYVLVKLKNGQKMVKELLFQKADSVAVMSVNGEVRRTLQIDEIDGIQAVGAVVSPSKWRP
ncbi:Peptidase S24-like protein [compost metagenome]